MVSLCIKTNNNTAIDYLMVNIAKINLDDIVFVKKNFSKYTNIIIHYRGNNIPEFYKELASVITNCIIDKYEDSIIYKLLLLNYFYFDEIDMNIIKNNCKLLIENKHSDTVSVERIKNVKLYIINQKMLLIIKCINNIFFGRYIWN